MNEFSNKSDFLNMVTFLLPDIISDEVKHFISCQFALESSFGTSGFASCNNNFCGMKVPALRMTICCNPLDIGEFARYSGITSCVHDYLLWLQSFKFTRQELNNLELFKRHLDISGYCPDLDYITKISKLYSQYYE